MKVNLGYIVIGIFVIILAIRCFTKKSIYEGLDDASLIRAAESRQEDYLKTQDKYWANRRFPQTAPGLSGDVKFKKLDLVNLKKLEKSMYKSKFDAVFHFAGLSIVDKSYSEKKRYYENNVIATKNLINTMIKNNINNLIVKREKGINFVSY